MAESLADQLRGSTLRESLLRTAASEDLDAIPPDFDDRARFVISAVRAAARRRPTCPLCMFLYSEAPLRDGGPLGFARILHMQDGHGRIEGQIILTSKDANNGACLPMAQEEITAAVEQVEHLGLGGAAAVIWDGRARTATVYPDGVAGDAENYRFPVSESDHVVSQDDVCQVLDTAYHDNLKNPSGRTARLWADGELIKRAEDEIERHLKGQIALFFAGRSQPVRVLSQVNTAAGRTDLVVIQQTPNGPFQLVGGIELKVLRGPYRANHQATAEGLNQSYSYYIRELHCVFATLALYDVSDPPNADKAQLRENQNPTHLEQVRIRLFHIYSSPQKWRNATAASGA